jgi:DNA ligase D-like protein (predicted 3'-phosphoesterase)
VPKYVIHEHHASHLHWDLRLEHKGVLKSWAIPKKPTDDPSIKRLCIQVEDHPLDYADFEGTIPEGQYGAGEVKIWDSGEYDAIEFNDDKVDMAIRGYQMHGHFHLIRFKKAGPKSWLFFKSKN